MIDPRLGPVSPDANALERSGRDSDALVERFCRLADAGVLRVMVAGGVRAEVGHAHTPREVQNAVLPRLFNLRPGLNAAQHISRIRIRAILRGNAQAGKHEADAAHLSEAAETGCIYFITHDRRILRKRDDLHASLPPTLRIATLAEFFEIFDRYVAGDRSSEDRPRL